MGGSHRPVETPYDPKQRSVKISNNLCVQCRRDRAEKNTALDSFQARRSEGQVRVTDKFVKQHKANMVGRVKLNPLLPLLPRFRAIVLYLKCTLESVNFSPSMARVHWALETFFTAVVLNNKLSVSLEH